MNWLNAYSKHLGEIMMENKIFFNFSYLALKLLGSGLYSNPWNAISELVANGFDAGASDVYLYIEKKENGKALIEIFDNGVGMDYEDLVSKYVFIGRNKREDSSDFFKGIKPTGRKGIGKLATLYLSDNINLIAKKENETTCWNLNISSLNDDEKPSLNSISLNSINIKAADYWNKISHGFFIQMLDVNLSGLGEKTAAGLANRLSDFYVLNSQKRRIWVSYNTYDEKNDFSIATKLIAYKNFYALFNNSDVEFEGIENQRLKIKTKYEELKIGYPFVKLDENSFEVSGKRFFTSTDGKPVEKEYRLVGWVGIHTSINPNEAKNNDPNFVKNRITSPNRLRLYVREKLAVENFLDYIKNTQAFSNYIEGEVSFDILDDDELPDIATANRQQLSEKDERVQLLIELLNPIVSKLISLRVRLATMLKNDEEKIEKRELDNLNIQHNQEIAEKDKEIEAANNKLRIKTEQNQLLAKGLHKNEERLAEAVHTINKSSVSIKNKIKYISKKYFDDKTIPSQLKKDISFIDLTNEKNLLISSFAFRGKFNLKSKIIKLDIGVFVSQYLKTMIDTDDTLKSNVVYDFDNPIVLSCEVTSLGIILDNIISNSKKANASNLDIFIYSENGRVVLDCKDDGEGYDKDVFPDPNTLFELGIRKSKEFGYGIGLYHIKELVQRNNGRVYIDSDYSNGFRIVVELVDEDKK